MTGNKTIFFVAASDRINYGDLLFPIIFKRIAENKGFTFYNYAIVKSNLSHFGALPTKSYRVLLKDLKNKSGKLIIGGGEVFFADWPILFSFINQLYSKLLGFKQFKRIEQKLKLAKLYLCQNKVLIPFCPAKSEIRSEKIKIFYNSVGGSYPYGKNDEEIESIRMALSDASIISVRDKRTKDELGILGINSKIVPDSAILLSDIFTQTEILKNKTLNDSNIALNYIFLQVGLSKGPKDLKLFSEELNFLSSKLNLKIILCPIGLAPRHQDDIILKEIKKYQSNFNYLEPRNIYDVMYLISNASMYIGTSLHGVITAQSFNTPFIGLNKGLVKVDSYTKSWLGKNYRSIDFEEIYKVQDVYDKWDYTYVQKRTIEQKKLVMENIYSILNA